MRNSHIAFANIVFAATASSSSPPHASYLRRLAEEFEVATSTVRRWGLGTAVPLPALRRKILEKIVEFVTEEDSK